MTKYPVTPTLELDNTGGFNSVPGVHETNTARSVHLIIEERAGQFTLRVQGAETLFDPLAPSWDDDLPLSPGQLWGAVAACRQIWRREAIDRAVGTAQPFLNEWDLSAPVHDGMLEQVLPQLALAGHQLFRQIFFPSKNLAVPGTVTRLGEIGEILSAAAENAGPMWLRVTSDSFYAPWNLLYTRKLDAIDGHDAVPAGFWGYQNLVEHVPLPPQRGAQPNRGKDLTFVSPLNVAVHVDENIDSTLAVDCVGAVKTKLKSYGVGGLTIAEGNTSLALARSLNQSSLDQHVLYFCCHAENEGDGTAVRVDDSYLALTDRQIRVTPGNLDTWLGSKVFKNGPIVFLNACQTGQMTSTFYQGFVPTFVNRRASAVIGTQTEVPARFAGEFARRFFDRFFKGRVSVGHALWALRREMLDVHRNPLGLLYSVYRGADVMLPAALPGA
jgi:hypothetical protein